MDSLGRNPYLFVVGCPRSGTTLLQRVLDAHPDLSVVNEAQFVPRVLAHHGLDGDAPLTQSMVAEVRSYRRFARLDLGEKAVARAASASATYSQFVARLYDAVASQQGTPFAGEKTPDYVRFLTLLDRLFPWARFVHLVRDGRDVALSLLEWAAGGKGPGRYALWQEDPIATSALWWSAQVTAGRRDGARIGANRYHEVRYEALVADPAAEAAQLASFLDLPYSPEMLRFHEGRRRDDPGLSAKDAWLAPTAGLRDWRRDMDSADAELFEALVGNVLDDLGYQRVFPEVSPAATARAAEFRDAWSSETAPRRAAGAAPTASSTADAIRALRDRGYEPAGEAFAIGRPDQTTIPVVSTAGDAFVAKLYPGGGEDNFTTMRTIWASSFGAERQPPGLPEPVEYISSAAALVTRRVDGIPLAELGLLPAHLVDSAVELLAELHASDARPERRRDARGVVRSMRRKAMEVAASDDRLGHRFAALVGALDCARPDGGTLVPSHGDFCARNILVTDDGPVLVDWDRFRLADPARDVAYFGVWQWASTVERRETPSWSTLERCLDRYDELRPDARVRKRSGFYVAAGLTRVAHAMVRTWKRDTDIVMEVVEEARRHVA